MGVVHKQLGAAAGSGTLATAAALYSASGTANTSTVVSSIVVCNAGTTARKYRIAVNTASATFAAGRYLVYEDTIAPNETVALTLGIVLDPTNRYLNVSSDHADVNFAAFGAEMS